MSLAFEIYNPKNIWAIDPISFRAYQQMLLDFRKGVQIDFGDTKNNTLSIFDTKSNETVLIEDSYQLRNNKDFNGIGIVNLNGPITKNGGASTQGTKQMSEQMLSLASDNRIKGFIIKGDSGGGSSNAVNILADTINEVKKTKPVYTLIEKDGMLASAAYGIASASNKIFAENGNAVVGSVGTMISFGSYPHGTVEPDGFKHITLYASKSTQKNIAFEEAINNDNYELIINDMLDPINESFVNMVQTNRPILAGTNFDNGHHTFASNAIGSFIDGIASFNEVVQMILNDTKSLNINNNSNTNNKIMTREELKQGFPDVYNSIVNEGVNREKERVNSWLIYASVDSERVNQGIQSGEEITPSAREHFLFKQNSQTAIKNLEQDSAKPVQTEETPVSQADETKTESEKAKDFFKQALKSVRND